MSMITTVKGLPSFEFIKSAWADEPLTAKLKGADIPFCLPPPDEDVSLLAQDVTGQVIGQCSANRAETYWNHVEQLDPTDQNESTQVFAKIHNLAVQTERDHFQFLDLDIKTAYHRAGIAILPEFRGQNLGRGMIEESVEECKKLGAKVIYCETTNRYSANLMENFELIREFPYSSLAVKFNAPKLSELDDSFSIWCYRA